MNYTTIRRFVVATLFSCLLLSIHAQPGNDPGDKDPKPYRILTSGKKITVKSTRDIKSVMVWTASGHRIVEQKEINSPSYSFTINVNEKIFFMMMELQGEKRYTEKIGVQ